MSQTAIPFEFERYLQSQISAGTGPDMNEMIFAYIPGLDASQPIDRNQGLPPSNQWVHRQDIDQLGKMGDNALAYSVVIPGNQPAFTFNAIFLRDKAVAGSCGFVVHKAQETKELGSALTRTLVMEYNGAAALAGVTVDAGTWQIDFSARLQGMDEDHRLACLDNYGQVGFVSGFDVVQQADPNKYNITSGITYVGGLRAVLANDVLQTISAKPNALWLDVYRDGTSLSKWENHVSIIASGSAKSDYVDSQGRFHYVAHIADIAADGSVVDRRQRGGMQEHLAADDPHSQYPLKGDVTPLRNLYFSYNYQSALILLIPYIDSGKHSESAVIGRMEFRRGTELSSDRLEVLDLCVKSSYNKTRYSMTRHYFDWGWVFCLVSYKGKAWLALKSTSNNVQQAAIKFSGLTAFGANGYDPEDQFKIITFQSLDPANYPPTNPEVASSIIDVDAHQSYMDETGSPFFSGSNPPEIADIPELNSELSERITVSTLVGVVMKFSTDVPRVGFIKGARIELLRSDYPKLWAVVEAAGNFTEQSLIDAEPDKYAAHYGTGDGVTTFTTPDYHRGHYHRGATPGLTYGESQGDAIRNITGTATGVQHKSSSTGAGAFTLTNSGTVASNLVDGTSSVWNHSFDASRVVPTADENRPKTINTYIYIYHGEEAA
ncbi:phage tail protein [Photobacterium halotolerans]|uniref:phage tail-collar fiber domain-containing protein n=1 Tax=Photobacterium halotolerans TaxID=265726 RepID=UPI00069617C4|nr:phage tail protein [Photobacterium halotolerans]